MKLDPFATAADMLRALSRRRVSAVELLDFHVARTERLDGKLNAIWSTARSRRRSRRW
jgi:Asp-tRNA(Asn)/Glu-tRNA(Gln) amidotransferase A subunit family amidase